MMNYPLLDIRSYDQLSNDLAGLVTGTFNFMGLPHEARVIRLHALIELYCAVKRIGDLEHTSDWDWRIVVLHAPGDEMGTYTGTDDDHYSDSIELPYETVPGDYIDRFARWQMLRVETFSYETDAQTYTDVPIDDIRLITIYQEG
jgi:hypothetical protein